jgi:hypothetical protein
MRTEHAPVGGDSYDWPAGGHDRETFNMFNISTARTGGTIGFLLDHKAPPMCPEILQNVLQVNEKRGEIDLIAGKAAVGCNQILNIRPST